MHGSWGHPRGRVRYFTEQEDQQIRELTAEGLSASLVGERLNRTRNSIIGRMHRTGIKRELPVSKSKPATSRKGVKMPPRVKKLKLKPQPEILPLEPPPLVPQCDPVNILGLKNGPIVQCRAIVVDKPEPLYCAAQTKPGVSWCPAHHAEFFRPQVRR